MGGSASVPKSAEEDTLRGGGQSRLIDVAYRIGCDSNVTSVLSEVKRILEMALDAINRGRDTSDHSTGKISDESFKKVCRYQFCSYYY